MTTEEEELRQHKTCILYSYYKISDTSEWKALYSRH